MLLSHFYRELDKTAIIFEFLGKCFRNLGKLFLDRTFPLMHRHCPDLRPYLRDSSETFLRRASRCICHETKAPSPTLCNKFEPWARSVRCFSIVSCTNFRIKHVAKGKISPLRRFSIPFLESLSDMRNKICSSIIILGLSGISGQFQLFRRTYSGLCFRLLHRSFQP